MCGIIGYVGKNKTKNVLLEGLKRLEYRGYDSAGIALLCNNELFTEKSVGKIVNLDEKTKDKDIVCDLGIAHTRWATHGEPTEKNAHPHLSCNGDIA
ncbi:glutamine--fructose-6-phosphate transaminase (isomerizing), partial [bacterium (Candidatus Howlettbacteria) CG_4_10_14_0_8_um_filter_40_9]